MWPETSGVEILSCNMSCKSIRYAQQSEVSIVTARAGRRGVVTDLPVSRFVARVTQLHKHILFLLLSSLACLWRCENLLLVCREWY